MSEIELPQGWKEDPLSTLVERLESGVSVNPEDKPCAPDEFGILKTSCVNGGKFDPSQNKVIVANEVVRAASPPTVTPAPPTHKPPNSTTQPRSAGCRRSGR